MDIHRGPGLSFWKDAELAKDIKARPLCGNKP
jgi:hypothetical protein